MPISPITLVTPTLVTGPFVENNSTHSAEARFGAIGPFNTRLPHPIGVYPLIPETVIAPEVDNALPSSVSPVFILIAALLAIIVPRIVVPAAKLTRPSTFQNTLHACAPLINFIFDNAFAENAP